MTDTIATLPNGCRQDRAERLLAAYDSRMRGGYKNQQIAARQQLKHATGMGVRELRRWLHENPRWRTWREIGEELDAEETATEREEGT